MTPILLGLGSAGAPPPEPTTVEYRTASATDATYYAVWADWRPTDEQIFPRDIQGRDANFNLRFAGVAIPQGATITNAFLTCWSRANRSGSNATDFGVLGAEQVDNPTSITNASNHNSRRTNVGTTVEWAWPNMTSNQQIDSQDITAIVQQIVNRGGWSSGNAIMFFCQNNNVANSGWNEQGPEFHSNAVNGGSQYLPRLTVTYVE